MKLQDETSTKIAEFLLQIKAIKLDTKKPFSWASGWKSPIYCDNRKTLSYPKIRTFIRQQMVQKIINKIGKPDVIAGVATGGIAIGALVAQELNLPYIYVRSAEKGHGLGNKIEGVIEQGQSVVIIEDLISTGSSSLKVVDALRESGCAVKGMVAIFTYNFATAEENFKKAKCKLETLSSFDVLSEVAVERKYINGNEIEVLKAWHDNPESWG